MNAKKRKKQQDEYIKYVVNYAKKKKRKKDEYYDVRSLLLKLRDLWKGEDSAKEKATKNAQKLAGKGAAHVMKRGAYY